MAKKLKDAGSELPGGKLENGGWVLAGSFVAAKRCLFWYIRLHGAIYNTAQITNKAAHTNFLCSKIIILLIFRSWSGFWYGRKNIFDFTCTCDHDLSAIETNTGKAFFTEKNANAKSQTILQNLRSFTGQKKKKKEKELGAGGWGWVLGWLVGLLCYPHR
jgi:hypothetical protein